MVGFTGTQEGLKRPQHESLRKVFSDLVKRNTTLHHGDCVGSDAQAHHLWKSHGGQVVGHPPLNPKKRAFCHCDVLMPPKDYLSRNHDVVDLTKTLVACPKGMSEETRSGTWATVRYARQLHRHIIIIFPDGTIKEENGG